jgi:surface-anchored protein
VISDRLAVRKAVVPTVVAAAALTLLVTLAPSAPSAESKQGSAATHARAAKKTTLRKGHIDAVSAKFRSGDFRTLVKDATKGNNKVKWREPESVLVRVAPRSEVRLRQGLEFIGPTGKRVWMIPQVEKPGVIWSGWNTEAVNSSQIEGDVDWNLKSLKGPGKVVIFQTGPFGDFDVLFNTRKKLPQQLAIPLGTHAHANWAFTRKGTYRMRYSMSARAPSGNALRDAATLTFRVGKLSKKSRR